MRIKLIPAILLVAVNIIGIYVTFENYSPDIKTSERTIRNIEAISEKEVDDDFCEDFLTVDCSYSYVLGNEIHTKTIHDAIIKDDF